MMPFLFKLRIAWYLRGVVVTFAVMCVLRGGAQSPTPVMQQAEFAAGQRLDQLAQLICKTHCLLFPRRSMQARIHRPARRLLFKGIRLMDHLA
jgi:hypothetical protein